MIRRIGRAEHKERYHLVPVSAPGLRNGRIILAPWTRLEGLQDGQASFGIFGPVDAAQRPCDRLSVFVPALNASTQTATTLLCPASEMVEAILDGRRPKGVTLPKLMEPFPVEWIHQTGCPLQCPALLIGGPTTGGSNCLGRIRRARLFINAKDRNRV
jgi:hypothetical protein